MAAEEWHRIRKQKTKAGRVAATTLLALASAVTAATGQTVVTPTPTPTTTTTATKRIEGQVFIVTKSGTAVKLALVQVSAIPLGQTEQYLREVEREVIGERHKADSFVNEAKAAVRNATKAREQHYQAWSRQLGDPMQELKKRMRGAYDASNAEYEALVKRVWKMDARLEEAVHARHVMHSAAPYFTKLPEPVATTKTDADGKFSLTVPAGDEYVLASRAKRSLPGGGSEHYFWLVKAQGSTVMLSNDNLTSAGSPDSLLTTTE
jgi:hypothetical protein